MTKQIGDSDYKGYSEKVVQSILGDLNKKNPDIKTPAEYLIDRAKEVTLKVHRTIQPILQAGGGFDKGALIDMATKLYLEEFNKNFSKEELVNLVTVMHVEIIINQIVAADPTGSGKADLMSGV